MENAEIKSSSFENEKAEYIAQTPQTETKSKAQVPSLVLKYIVFGFLFTLGIGLFSIIMSTIASNRNQIYDDVMLGSEKIYNGPIMQSAPSLGALEMTDSLYRENSLTIADTKRYVENTFVSSTDGSVVIKAEFAKKGLAYIPSYRTQFNTKYILMNTLSEESMVNFEFPFPVNMDSSEISNAKLIVDGEEVQDAKAKIKIDPNKYSNYGYYNDTDAGGLRWSGKIPSNGEIVVEVSYDTVGLSLFNYEGMENTKGAQDFNFLMRIEGIKSYNVRSGLSVDNREFGKDFVELSWIKPSLYSRPKVEVSVGDKINPSTQVSKVYLMMVPIYLALMAIILFLCYKFGKALTIFDMFLVTLLFIAYFPLVHYLSSFTIDPTMELFYSFANVGYFSMPLYLAFALAFTLVAGLIFYLIGRLSGFKFALKFILPALFLFLAFFPIVVTVPEYSMLLVILGVVALLAIIVQVRMKLK